MLRVLPHPGGAVGVGYGYRGRKAGDPGPLPGQAATAGRSALKTIQVKVKPNARSSTLEQLADGTWLARLKAPPVDGKANAELIALVARQFGQPKSRVSISRGTSGRLKRVTIADD